MRYAQIRDMDISNGPGVGVSLFTQGCRAHCPGCHNSEQWNFYGGKPFTTDTIQEILDLCARSYITRFSILGGEPLEPENTYGLSLLLQKIKMHFPQITVWLYTGRTWEELMNNTDRYDYVYLKSVLRNVDVLVDGPYVDEERDITLAFKGSHNQRIIDVQKTLEKGQVVLCEI